MKLKVDNLISEITEKAASPEEKEYIEWVADTLNCEVKDLTLLASLDPEDEQGNQLSSFFPEKYQNFLIHEDKGEKQIPALMFDNFFVGSVYMGNYKGVPFIANKNTSSFTVYINRQNLKEYES